MINAETQLARIVAQGHKIGSNDPISNFLDELFTNISHRISELVKPIFDYIEICNIKSQISDLQNLNTEDQSMIDYFTKKIQELPENPHERNAGRNQDTLTTADDVEDDSRIQQQSNRFENRILERNKEIQKLSMKLLKNRPELLFSNSVNNRIVIGTGGSAGPYLP